MNGKVSKEDPWGDRTPSQQNLWNEKVERRKGRAGRVKHGRRRKEKKGREAQSKGKGKKKKEQKTE